MLQGVDRYFMKQVMVVLTYDIIGIKLILNVQNNGTQSGILKRAWKKRMTCLDLSFFFNYFFYPVCLHFFLPDNFPAKTFSFPSATSPFVSSSCLYCNMVLVKLVLIHQV